MNIAIAFNHKYTKYAYVLLTSLFENNRDTQIEVYILHHDLTAQDKKLLLELAEVYVQKIDFKEVNLEGYKEVLPTTEAWSVEMYYRLLIGEILPEAAERVLYLDVDMIVNCNLKELYEIDLQGNELAVADDPMIQGNYSRVQEKLFSDIEPEVRYFNSGMLLMDLNRIRKNHCFKGYLKFAEEQNYELTNPDQDILNALHCGTVLFVNNHIWNVFSQCAAMEGKDYTDIKQNGGIIHFAGRKPWNSNGMHYGIEKLWWDYAKLTPFYHEMLEQVFLNDLEDTSYQQKVNLLKENADLKHNLDEALALCKKLCGMLNIEI